MNIVTPSQGEEALQAVRAALAAGRIVAVAEYPIRRSRGYAPYPVHLPFPVRQVLAVGAELKNTFCLTRERYGFLSQHIGDMENYETLRFFEDMVEQLKIFLPKRPIWTKPSS